jgi:hypothetical protein
MCIDIQMWDCGFGVDAMKHDQRLGELQLHRGWESHIHSQTSSLPHSNHCPVSRPCSFYTSCMSTTCHILSYELHVAGMSRPLPYHTATFTCHWHHHKTITSDPSRLMDQGIVSCWRWLYRPAHASPVGRGGRSAHPRPAPHCSPQHVLYTSRDNKLREQFQALLHFITRT